MAPRKTQARTRAKSRGNRKAPPPRARGGAAHGISPGRPAARIPVRSGLALLLVATVIAFLPAFGAGFVDWDDPNYVAQNRLLTDPDGLQEIWDPDSPRLPAGGLQYYPLVFTTYRIEHRLWGLDARGYHATNVALHLANTVLAFLLVCGLGASPWVALWAAGIFALHPAQVSSVVWVSERKNVLSGLFSLAAMLLYFRHRGTGRNGPYAASLFAFAAALLSKAQAAALPLALLLSDRLGLPAARSRRTPPAQSVSRIAPMVAMALVAAHFVTTIEKQVIPAYYELPSLAERPLVAANAAWFYVARFLLPIHLSPLEPKWQVSASDLRWWIAVVAWLAAIALFAKVRKRFQPLELWGGALFFIPLLPVLGLVPFAYQHRSLVAEHFLYLSCLGGGLVVAAAGERLTSNRPKTRRGAVVATVALLAFYGAATHAESRHWRDNFSFWSHVFVRNPDAYPPNINLARHYEAEQDWNEAIRFYRRAVELRPANVAALPRYLNAVRKAGGPGAVIEACDERLGRGLPLAHITYLYRAESYSAVGRQQEARADYNRVLGLARRGSSTWRRARRQRQQLGNTGAGS